jgi:pimeloyl-ACP methyl ester carboxylesterase
MFGDQDDLSVLEVGEHLSSHIPGIEKVVIPDAAHLPNLEKPAAFNRNVLDFLQRRQKR